MDRLLVILTFAGSLFALIFALVTTRIVIGYSEGNDLMKKISSSIRQGANAYLRRQYRIVLIFFAVMFLVLGTMAILGLLTPYVPFAFITGGFFSALSGFVGMKVATLANARTANACREGLNRGLRVAFSAGSVMGFTVVGLGQVRVSTAKFLEEQGYVPETSAEEGGWNIPFIGFVHGTETMAREKRLEDNYWNIMYVAAYIEYFEDTWIDVFPEISSRPDGSVTVE